VVPSSYGRGEFAGYLAGMILATFFIAFTLRVIRRNLRAAKNGISEYCSPRWNKVISLFVPSDKAKFQSGKSKAGEVGNEGGDHNLGGLRVFPRFGAAQRLSDVEDGAGPREGVMG